LVLDRKWSGRAHDHPRTGYAALTFEADSDRRVVAVVGALLDDAGDALVLQLADADLLRAPGDRPPGGVAVDSGVLREGEPTERRLGLAAERLPGELDDLTDEPGDAQVGGRRIHGLRGGVHGDPALGEDGHRVGE